MTIENDLKQLYEMRMQHFGDELLNIFMRSDIERRHEKRFLIQYILKNDHAYDAQFNPEKEYNVNWYKIYEYIDARKKVIETEEVHLLVRESTEEMLKYFEPYRKQFIPSIFEAF